MKNEVIEMSRDNIQPKMSNLWVVDVEGIKREDIQSLETPSVTIKKNIFGLRKKIIGELMIEMIEPTESSYIQFIIDSIEQQSKFDINVKYVDPNGLVLSIVQYKNCLMVKYQSSSLSYEYDSILTNFISFQPQSIEILK